MSPTSYRAAPPRIRIKVALVSCARQPCQAEQGPVQISLSALRSLNVPHNEQHNEG